MTHPEPARGTGKVANSKHVQKAARAAKLAKALKANIKRRKTAAQDGSKP